jgi:predicted DNA-binding transcriptional regulator AlpA
LAKIVNDEFLSARDVCRFFGGDQRPLSIGTIYRWVQQGKLPPPIHLGLKLRRWRRSDCQRLMDAMVLASKRRAP